ncbi:GH92 family glycosyl hydrolase [uncultured Bacteroides sp.]|uniref:GH92 family glycosyl hydrolase n=1 Tax=uncultured Bacteroides sp. TaxID=162156 RepID=UPI002AA92628|nr:GH92 family glycosyl hydrolase [uncultured Bacteroides sp.]
MKRTFCLLSGILLSATLLNAQKVTRWVNPFIGTGAVESSLSGNNYPGATVPFGMVQLSPDTRKAPDWAQASGYDYNDHTIFGFSHTRLSGTGAADLIDILLLPTTDGRNQSNFSHKQESAHPGYYQVLLTDDNINAELTATTHVGLHRYQFPTGADAQVILDIDHSANKGSWGRRIINAQIRIVNSTTVEGYRIITGWAKLRKIYFHIEFSKVILSSAMSDGDRKYKDVSVINGTNLLATLHFNVADGNALISKVALSPVSIENARLNMAKEVPEWNFDAIASEAETKWEKALSKINVKGTDLQKELFYTALYHAMVQPNTMSDVNGEYMAADYTTRHLPEGETHYSTFSLWDTFRAAHPLYNLIQPDREADFVKSMIRQYDYYGYLPIWQLWGQDNYCMIGNHSIPVIVESIMKGIPHLDNEKAYEAIHNSLLTPHPNFPVETWEKYGYMPENRQSQSVSITLEQAYDDWCAAQLAKKLGKNEDYTRFVKRSEFYRNLFNSTSGFFQPKDNKGNWIEPFDPYKYGANGGYPFTEGNAWQYLWYVPQNIPALIQLIGGDKAFAGKLDTFFTTHHQSGELNDNASGFVGQYAHGNEPCHHVAYLYNYVGQPWKAQKYISHIIDSFYNDSSSGYVGNDDCGEMSSWYVFSAMGFYPVNPTSGIYVIGTPVLEESAIKLANGKIFTVKAPRKTADEIYIQSARLNGKTYSKTYITHQDIMNGSTLEFKMGKKPSSWGKSPSDRPLYTAYN